MMECIKIMCTLQTSTLINTQLINSSLNFRIYIFHLLLILKVNSDFKFATFSFLFFFLIELFFKKTRFVILSNPKTLLPHQLK